MKDTLTGPAALAALAGSAGVGKDADADADADAAGGVGAFRMGMFLILTGTEFFQSKKSGPAYFLNCPPEKILCSKKQCSRRNSSTALPSPA
ncbi:MAG: hypothetical protein EAZ34_08370 [Polaromonas sp.]|nr:MAG: hypothetical protein EAZ34_08370 [Polaromonas sp.]